MLKTIKKNNFLFIVMLSLHLLSCDSKQVFDSYQSVSEGSWSKDAKILFEFTVKDTLTKQNLFINLRNNNNYEFSNLFLITQMDFPDGKKIIDTLEYDMADKTGKFLGRGFSEVKENKLFYKENITFPISGNYKISVSQAMRKNGEVEGVKNLNGITEVGFRIEKIQ